MEKTAICFKKEKKIIRHELPQEGVNYLVLRKIQAVPSIVGPFFTAEFYGGAGAGG